MSGDYEPNDSLSLFREMVERQSKQQQPKIEQCLSFLKRHQLPTPDEILKIINSFVGEPRQRILCHHIFWNEWKLRRGLASLIHASHQASIDICRHDAALGELALSEGFQEEVDYTIGHAAQKDAVAYCALVIGVRDTLIEIQKNRVDIADDISRLRDSLFNSGISEFLRKLRNNLLHGRVIIPQWEVSYGFEQQASTGSMMYNVRDLIETGKWNDASRNYVLTLHDEKVQLSSIVREHFRLVNDLRRDVYDLFAKNVTPSEKDFFDIEDSYKQEGRRQWAKIMVGQMASGKSPYNYLHKFFDPETLREILRRPSHSKEQVDFIMALKAAELDWDDELRSMMYQMFGVPQNLES